MTNMMRTRSLRALLRRLVLIALAATVVLPPAPTFAQPTPPTSAFPPPPAPAGSATTPDAPASAPATGEAASGAPSAQPAAAPSVPSVGAAMLPRDLSPWGMFANADLVVQIVMIGLVFASLVTWTVWLAKSLELAAAKRRARRHLRVLADARTLAEAAAGLGRARDPLAMLVRTAQQEARDSGNFDPSGLKERVVWLMERVEASAGRRMSRGMGVLASIGATAPFVGLFGTVWGIMNSFIGISNAHTTNLAVVAPGIAEALLATALGLAAAIPAVVIYNVFSRSLGAYRALIADGSALVMRLVSRDCDGGRIPLGRAAE